MKALRTQPMLRGAADKRFRPARTMSPLIRAMFNDIEGRKLSQASVAEAMGLTAGAVSNWKRGHCSPPLITVEAMAEVLGYRIVLEKIAGDSAGMSD